MNQWTGFFMIGISVMKELIYQKRFGPKIFTCNFAMPLNIVRSPARLPLEVLLGSLTTNLIDKDLVDYI